MLNFDISWVHSDSDYVYCSGGGKFWIFDQPMDANSEPISVSLIGSYGRPAVFWPYACFYDNVSGAGTISLIDLDNVSNPVVHYDAYSCSGSINAIALDSNNIYMSVTDGGSYYLVILEFMFIPFDVHVVSDTIVPDPYQVMEVFQPDDPVTSRLISQCEKWIDVYDITDPSNPLLAIAYGFVNNNFRDLCTEGDYVYALTMDTITDTSYLRIFDAISNVNKGMTSLCFDNYYVDVCGDFAYVTNNSGRLTWVDVSNPDFPLEDDSIVNYEKYGYVNAYDTHIYVVDPLCGIRFHEHDLVAGTVSNQGIIRGVNQPFAGVIDGDYLYACQFFNDENKSVITIDISDIENTRLAGYCRFDRQPNRIMKVNNGLIVATTLGTYWTIDNSDPTDLLKLVETVHPFIITGMTSTDDYLLIADSNEKLTICDFPSWPNINIVNTISIPTEIYNLKIYGNGLYCSCSNTVSVFDITDIVNPVLMDSYTASNTVFDIEFKGDYMYVLTWTTLETVNIENPFSFSPSANIPVPATGTPHRLTIDGQFGYVAANSDNSHLFRIWPPDNPAYIGKFYETSWISHSWEIFIVGDYYIDFRDPFGIEIMNMYP